MIKTFTVCVIVDDAENTVAVQAEASHGFNPVESGAIFGRLQHAALALRSKYLAMTDIDDECRAAFNRAFAEGATRQPGDGSAVGFQERPNT